MNFDDVIVKIFPKPKMKLLMINRAPVPIS